MYARTGREAKVGKNNLETLKCPICGKTGLCIQAECTDYMVSHEHFTVLKCSDCGIAHTVGAPEESRTSIYDKVSLKLKQGDNPSGLLNIMYYYVRRVMLTRKAGLVERLSYRQGGTLLNYGAKTGYFSSFMEDRGWNVTSVEKYHEERQFSLEMFHHRMIDLPEFEMLHPQSFDVITMWHVFEHNYHPDSLLDKCFGLLRPQGLLFLACPNLKSADAAFYGPCWAAYDVPRHLWHFDAQSITRLALRHGFILMHHEALPYDSFYISILSEKNRGSRFYILKGLVRGFKFRMRSLSHRGQSSSLVYVFRKNVNHV